MDMKYTAKAFAIAAAAIMAVGCSQNKGQDALAAAAAEDVVPVVSVAKTEIRDVLQEEVYASTVQANVVNNVVPQSGGRIKKINVEIGDFVTKGQVLAEMEAVNLLQSRLKLVNDSTELSRLKGLYEAGAISKSDFETAEMGYKVSRTSYENLLENTVLRSPISGVITARGYDAGDMYAMQLPLYVVQQITPVKLLVAISESRYSKVEKGQSVTLTADALPGRTFEGRINRIYPVIDPASHTFTAEVVVANSDRALRPGMYANVKVLFGINSSVVVPGTALVKQQGSGVRTVFVLNADGTVTSRVVTTGRRADEFVEVLEGLGEGETVVTAGQAALKDGIKVEVI